MGPCVSHPCLVLHPGVGPWETPVFPTRVWCFIPTWETAWTPVFPTHVWCFIPAWETSVSHQCLVLHPDVGDSMGPCVSHPCLVLHSGVGDRMGPCVSHLSLSLSLFLGGPILVYSNYTI